ncbi:MAG: nitroreductase [Anaerolinea sp.]|nr:nitroreductase [Anaerolinea sp.]
MTTKDGITFIQQSENRNLEPSAEGLGLPQPPLELPFDNSKPIIKLPPVEDLSIPKTDFLTAVEQRLTLRRYREDPLSLPELTYLLWCTQGVKRVTARPVTMRTVPSGGARHPFETYLVISRVTGLEPGLYRYLAIDHSLLQLECGSQFAERISEACLKQQHIRDCPVSFWWCAVPDRSTWRYSTRGYRYMLLDAGHICQNLYLSADVIDCGVCAIGSFDDTALNGFWGLDGINQFMIYGASLGKKPADVNKG